MASPCFGSPATDLEVGPLTHLCGYFSQLPIGPERELASEVYQQIRLANGTVKFPRRRVTAVFDHPTAGDQRFGPMMLAAHIEWHEVSKAYDGCDLSNSWVATNGVSLSFHNTERTG